MDYSKLSPEQLILACTSTGDAAAWEEFVRRFHKLIAVVVLRIARRWGDTTRQLVDDLVQEIYLKLCADDCKLLRSFQATHEDAFYGYLKVIAVNLTLDHFKALQTAKRGGLSGSESIDSDDVVSVGVLGPQSDQNVTEQRILMNEIDACLKSVEAGTTGERDRMIFWLYYRVGLTAKAIARLPSIGLSTKGVESTLLRLTRLVRKRIAFGVPEVSSKETLAEGI